MDAFKPTHRHYKGALYEVLFKAINADNAGDSAIQTVYRNVAGNCFTRYSPEFDETLPDGRKRFERI